MAYKHPTKIYKSLLHRIFKETGISKSKEIARLGTYVHYLDYLLTTPS